ncbi:MAG: hypothetical protein LBJ59_12070 [Zoogloeaceae bacterium]|jgi:hypothetical protein|nr:hypothetical protein [Zoogloeaceae bacterium]
MVLDLPGVLRARLKADADVLGHFRQIGGAMELSAAQRATRTLPAVFVLPLAESAGMPLWAGEFRQKKELRVALVIAARDVAGGLAAARSIVERVLIPADTGWLPPGCFDVMAWAEGKLAQIDDNGCIWWQDEYATTQFVKTPV